MEPSNGRELRRGACATSGGDACVDPTDAECVAGSAPDEFPRACTRAAGLSRPEEASLIGECGRIQR